ncbi:MAG TPA: glycosyltransferase family 2 protein [Solirubrobacteraceae bacterium]|jgi:ribosomal protein S27E
MSAQPTDHLGRRFEFDPTEAVVRSRASGRFIKCPACGADTERYLFHERGARFVQCRSCGAVYVNPPAREVRDYFDTLAAGERATIEEREHVRKELDDVVRYASGVYETQRGAPPGRIVVAGRMPEDVSISSAARIDAVRLTHEQTLRLVHDSDISPIAEAISDDVDLVVLNQLLEACPLASQVAAELAARLPDHAMLVVVYGNAASLPGRIMRRNWRRFFHWKAVYFNSENLRSMLERAGLHFVAQSGLSTSYAVTRALDLALPGTPLANIARRLGLGAAKARVPTGTYVSIFERGAETETDELLSVIVPVFNEAAYVRAVLDELLGKQFVVPHEVIIVESNSTDGTREIAQTFEGRPGVQIIYEDRPRGKGAAVRRGLEAATGTIVLIQDADFEYDLDDYDMLLEPILQRRTSFVLGSRSLGLDDWKVRRFARSRVKAFLMNVAQLIFARTFNLLYQQRVTDVNTMFKVFRRECIENVDFAATGFSFDIELACMLVKSGYSPMEVPVNYVARGFEEGKKINFVSEFFPSFFMFFQCRFGRRGTA